MWPEDIREIAGWLIGVVLINVVGIVGSIITWIKAAKMMPKEIVASDLDNEATALENKAKEISILEQYEERARKVMVKNLKIAERLEKLETDYGMLEKIIEEQSIIMQKQTTLIDTQEATIKEQEIELFSLGKALRIAKAYTVVLIQQMKDENIIPVESLDIDDCIE